MRKTALAIAVAALTLGGLGAIVVSRHGAGDPRAALRDDSDGDDWPGYGRTYGEQHYSPLAEINRGNVSKLGVAWYYDLPPGNPVTVPVEVAGVLYTATGYSVVRAFEAASGKLLWTFDPKVPQAAGRKLRGGYGSRGLAWGDGRIYVATHDGRLIALDAEDGRQLWSAMTVGKDDARFITGAPRFFDGKVIIGHGGSDTGNVRGYVSTYDAATGKQLWRFYTVPGDPAKGFEDDVQAMAAKTWTGQWWKYGGGGTAWNAFAFDPETDTIFVGTGNGSPWNQRVRSPGGGDNLFLCSILALDAKTGRYKWHYQVNPGETWDYNAAMDMQFAELDIGGRMRKVLIQAPKNGFLYVLDRITGELISADPITNVTWATGVDLKSGRPIERPGARFPNGSVFMLAPTNSGAHTWLPSSYSPQTRLVYLPISNVGRVQSFDDNGVDLKGWTREPDNRYEAALNTDRHNGAQEPGSSALLAWDPIAKRATWRVPTVGSWSGGVLSTGGGLVFHGQVNGLMTAYDAATGKVLWRYDMQAPVVGPPISYRAAGRQYVAFITGAGTSAGVVTHQGVPIDYRTQARRVVVLALGGDRRLPPATPVHLVAPDDPGFRADLRSAERGAGEFIRCVVCHGVNAEAGGTAPDLRTSPAIVSAETFEAIVRQGALVESGMPRFEELTARQLADLRQFIRTRAQTLREKTGNR